MTTTTQNIETVCQHSKISIEELAYLTAKTPTAVLGSAQFGKTTLAKHIVKALTKIPNVKTRVFDSSTKWLFESPCEVVFTVPQPITTVYELQGELMAYEEQSTINDNLLRELLEHKSIVFDFSEIVDVNYERNFQARLIFLDKQRLIRETKKNKGRISERVVYCYEETQGTLGTNSLRRTAMQWLAKSISVSANYGLSWLIVTRRASEVSTQIFEHSNQKAVTNSNQPNSIRKLKSIFSWENVEIIKSLQLGEFLVLTPQGTYYLQTTIYKDRDPKSLAVTYTKQPSKLGRLKRLFKWLIGAK